MNFDINQICVVIVTYGSRLHYLEQILLALCQGTVKPNYVIIVDNNSTPPIDIKANIAEKFPFHLEIIRNLKNLGSAKGYKLGLQKASHLDCSLIWLLDDDNRPAIDALEKLLAAKKILNDNKNHLFASFRTDRKKFVQVAYDDGELKLGYKNSFMSFKWSLIPKKIYSKIISRKESSKLQLKHPIKKIEYSIFGGLLFNKEWLESIGYPNEDFFLYIDDREFTTRITKAGGEIFLVATSLISDLDISFENSQRGTSSRPGPRIFSQSQSPMRLYYTVRNIVFYEKKYLVTNNAVYFVNLFSYLAISFINGMFINQSFSRTLEKFKVVYSAISDGLKGNMGQNSNY